MAGRSGFVELTTRWTRPYSTQDTLVVNTSTGLVPVSETLRAQGHIMRYQYRGARVVGTIVDPKGRESTLDTTFAVPVFAFNQVEQVIRSLPLRDGARYLVPLFSEMDRALEIDSLTVRPQAGAAGHWLVRFADPAVTIEYILQGSTRVILDQRTTNRRSGGMLHYVRET